MFLDKFEVSIFKRGILLLHIPVSNVNGNITFYYVNVTSCIVSMCAVGISTTIIRNVLFTEK